MSLLPDPILEGVGDSLLTAADRYAYTVSVPRMYKIVGREGVKALHSEKMAGSMGSPPSATSCEGCSGKKKQKKQKNWEEAKREYDSVGGTPFHGVRAIAKKTQCFFISCLKCYAGPQTQKCHHGYDTDSSALVSDSGSDDSGDGDFNRHHVVFFWGWGEGGLLAGMKRFVPSTCLARAPPFPIVCSHFWF